MFFDNQGESIRVRRINEIQEADKRTTVGFEPDPEPTLHALVVADDQSSQRLRRFPGKSKITAIFHSKHLCRQLEIFV